MRPWCFRCLGCNGVHYKPREALSACADWRAWREQGGRLEPKRRMKAVREENGTEPSTPALGRLYSPEQGPRPESVVRVRCPEERRKYSKISCFSGCSNTSPSAGRSQVEVWVLSLLLTQTVASSEKHLKTFSLKSVSQKHRAYPCTRYSTSPASRVRSEESGSGSAPPHPG